MLNVVDKEFKGSGIVAPDAAVTVKDPLIPNN